MDKKILLSGAAALMLGASLFAAPASAAFDFGISGKSTIKLTMDDHCKIGAATDLISGDITGASSITGFTDGDTELDDDIVSRDTTCNSGESEDNPILSIANEAAWTASTTLANGLSVTVADDFPLTDGGSMTLSGAFGDLQIKKGVDSAVKASFAAHDADIGVTGNNIGGHKLATSGAAGTGVLWTAPTMGGMDIMVSYHPNSADDGETKAPYMDTIGFGAKMGVGDLTVSAGFESATATTGSSAACSQITNSNATGATPGTTLLAHANQYLGGNNCGNESVMAIGMATSAGGLDLSAGYTKLDTGEADTTVMNVRVGTSVSDYSITLDYVNAEKAYGYASTKDAQSVLGIGASTALGDGVNLKLNFSNNSYNIAGTGAETNYKATAAVEANF